VARWEAVLPDDSVRIDKWLWAVRVFKTRGLAADSCRHGHVRIAGQPVKPSRQVRMNDVIVVKKEQMTRTFKVLRIIERRVGAPAAREYAEDQTPASEWEKPKEPLFRPLARPRGSGRPTKKDRRRLDNDFNPTVG
jgi:ribosome-associated heat shock protein Hsp15